MKRITGTLLVIIIALALSGCATTQVGGGKLPLNSPTVVIVGGTRMTAEDFQPLQKEFPESVVIIANGYYPPHAGAEDLLRQIQEKAVKGPIIFIGHSAGGWYAREASTKIPDEIAAIVTISSPLGKFRYTPEFLSDMIFRPDDDDSTIPLFVIAGWTKKPPGKPWWIREESQSDGLVAVDSVMDTANRLVEGTAVFEGEEHSELLSDQRVISQIKEWLKPWLESKVVYTGDGKRSFTTE